MKIMKNYEKYSFELCVTGRPKYMAAPTRHIACLRKL